MKGVDKPDGGNRHRSFIIVYRSNPATSNEINMGWLTLTPLTPYLAQSSRPMVETTTSIHAYLGI